MYIENTKSNILRIELLDPESQEKKVLTTSKVNKMRIDLSNFSSGLKILKVIYDNGTESTIKVF